MKTVNEKIKKGLENHLTQKLLHFWILRSSMQNPKKVEVMGKQGKP